MEVRNWLEQHVPGFADFTPEERAAIQDFSLLWSLFEHEVLGDSASAASIVDAIAAIKGRRPLNLDPFQQPILHFRQRYYDGRQFTPAFGNLHLRPNDRRPLVETFVAARTNDEAEILAGLLIIVFRLRNNLFHGVKWAYGIRNQLGNFTHANTALMRAMELHRDW